MRAKQKKNGAFLLIFVTLKATLLVAVFSTLHPGLSLDASEAVYWAQEIQWGGFRHPPMVAWLLRAFFFFLPENISTYYFLGQITLATTYIFVWLLAKEFLQPLQALLATLVLACGIFYSCYSLTYNPNTLSLLAWAAFNFFFWKALNDRRCRWWIALALAATVALLTKYAAVLLFFVAATTVLIVPQWRSCLKTYKPYLAAGIVGLLTLPHWLWVVNNDFITLTYATGKLSRNVHASFFPPLYFPLRFAYGQLVHMLPILLTFAVFLLPSRKKILQKKEKEKEEEKEEDSSYNKKVFLLTVGLMPFFVTIVLAMVLQRYMHSLWGLFYWNLSGISLFYFFRETVKKKIIAGRLWLFFTVGTFLVLLTTVGFLALPFVASQGKGWLFNTPYQQQQKKKSVVVKLVEQKLIVYLNPRYRTFLDMEFVARTISEEWRKQRSSDLAVIGGSQWLASSVFFFSRSRLSIVTLLDDKSSAWVRHNREQWNEEGGVVLWFVQEGAQGMPLYYRQALRERSYVLQQPFAVPWRRILGVDANIVRAPAPIIGWAIVPPLQKKSE